MTSRGSGSASSAELPCRRLFFALWPDPSLRSVLVQHGNRLDAGSGRRVPDANLHLTLVFLGDVPADRIDALETLAGTVAATHRPFTLVLDRYGTFDRARVAWLGGPAVEAGNRLVEDLAAGARDCGLDVERRSWRPHVTLRRRIEAAPDGPAPAPIAWRVRDFVLVESIRGRPYQVLRSWPLE
ncbi:RNA 2',3'-cyclic phosphodiesterase [Halomonas denitrificans]|nr:RNA 2',3'-cyclic phosphodiesterase [Halomonas denitrificans]